MTNKNITPSTAFKTNLHYVRLVSLLYLYLEFIQPFFREILSIVWDCYNYIGYECYCQIIWVFLEAIRNFFNILIKLSFYLYKKCIPVINLRSALLQLTCFFCLLDKHIFIQLNKDPRDSSPILTLCLP